MPHTYHLTLSHMTDQKGQTLGSPICAFDFENHDDLGLIIGTARENALVADQDVQALVVGLKLLTEVTMKNRKSAPFNALWPHLGAFIHALKAPKAGGKL